MNKHLVVTCVHIDDLIGFLTFVVYHTSVTLESGDKPYYGDLKNVFDSDQQNIFFYYKGGLESQLAYTQKEVEIKKIADMRMAIIENKIFKIVDNDKFWQKFCNNTLVLRRAEI